MNGARLRQVILDVLKQSALASKDGVMDTAYVFDEVFRQLHANNDEDLKQAILTYWHDLSCSGQIAPGLNMKRPDPARCFVTQRGRETLKHLSRDPANREGYMEYLAQQTGLDDVARAYVEEALKTYAASCYKATAVMIGAAAERLVLDLRDAIQARLKQLGKPVNKKL
jgi:hypothetical protein